VSGVELGGARFGIVVHRESEIGICYRIIGLEGDGTAVALFRFCDLSLLRERVAKTVMGLGQPGLDG
jgi:hypothetical protein